MCTMILLLRLLPGYPLVLAANRDEFLDRGFSAPHLWPQDVSEVRIFAGKDERKSGTWMGINQHGLVAAIVNRYTGHRDPDKCSRGQIVLNCLQKDSLQAVELFLEKEHLNRYNPFTLFCYAEDGALVVTNYQKKIVHRLSKGIYVITNCAPEDEADPKKAYIRTALGTIPYEPTALRNVLISLCRDHSGPQEFPFPVCVHLDRYGTVSSSILMLGKELDTSRLYYCEGPPCEGEYEDLTTAFLSVFG